ncbi:MAG TPA: metal ABC transporter ATP-binding protein [Thermoanaerobaculia bacterium]|jgi:zinc transport system ATP-binding protein|nr:metal ABC transporter ATP-binding protein [Thermoanaerobaculia bacterium]
MTEALLQVRGLTFGYGRELVLDHVDLDINPRDFLAVIGPNGGGKTTLIKAILGLLRPWSGEVISRIPRGHMGYVPQFSTFDRSFPLRVRDVVLMGKLGRRGLIRRYTREDREDVERILERLHLVDVALSNVAEVSGGQLQRVLIARALAGDPGILFLDEPTASIDAESREVLREILEELNQNIPVVVVTHDVTSISSMVQQIACINRRLFYHGTEINNEILEEVYGCPVELVAHGVPHRVLHHHH